MSISNLQVSTDSYYDLKCKSAEFKNYEYTKATGADDIQAGDEAYGASSYTFVWEDAGTIAVNVGTGATIALGCALPLGWEALGRTYYFSYESPNAQEVCSLNGVVNGTINFSVFNTSVGAVAPSVVRKIKILLV
jgi:hypothetical protein